MDDLERIRQERLQELQQRQADLQQQEGQAAEQAAAQEAAIEQLLQKVLEPEARERLTRIRLSRPDFASAVSQQLVALVQSGRLKHRLGDVEFRAILAKLTPENREINIKRK